MLAGLVLALQAHAQPAPMRLSQLGDAVPARQQEFFPAPSFEVVHAGGCGVMEGIASASDGSVYFTEITRSVGCSDAAGVQGGRIWVVPPGGVPRIFREPSNMAAGLAIDAQDRLVAAEGADYGGRRVSVTDLRSGSYRVVAYFHENRQFNAPNDVAIDRDGRIFFSDLRLFGPETIEQRINAVYRLDPPGANAKGLWPVSRILGNDAKMNGIELSPDGRTLYVGHCDPGTNALGEQGKPALDRTGAGGLVAYPLDAAGGPGAPRVLLDLEKAGCVDGMTTDLDGNLYLALPSAPSGPGVYVMTPEGVLVARLTLPNSESPVNVGFGRGPEAGTLYIATVGVGKVYRLRTGKVGFAPSR
ncbi:SMP-30/gluconolactonase/LRE family protein [Pseudacidovorax sp. NFM-22]|uniref:SMP-30/gluconolactonase/LRE family protein n=1 Tax=Pseudacidovorax sp. NFM-22 TaxID=2744469 RepID=UPI001F467517|nr:SMP-30/gluconolactonase/LRE family protein [Pseudacidovorax sp. NFM-22]